MRVNMDIIDIVGKKIVAVKGMKSTDKRIKHQTIPLHYVLLDDGETILEFEEQDYYTYHDCSGSARQLSIVKSKNRWKDIMINPAYGDSNVMLEYPF